MKKLLLSAVLAASFVALSANAATSTGTITIKGQVVSSTCNVAVNGSQSPTITLPTYDTNALAAVNASAGWTPVTMALTGCTAVSNLTSNTVFPYFTGSNIDTTTGYLKNATGAGNSNVQVAFSTSQSLAGALTLQSASGAQGAGSVALPTTGTANLSFTYYAGYVAATAAATAGAVNTTVQYALNYQ
jgi:major type 1 subunit fimbrin (pilin)